MSERGRAAEEEVAEQVEQVDELDPLVAVKKERDEYLDALQRLKAEFDNYRKRVARDQQELAARAHERLVRELVPVLDDLERALEFAAAHEEAQLEDGVRLVHRALADALAKEGLAEIATDGQVRSAHAGGAALAAVGGGGGDRDPGAAEGLPARRPRPAAGEGGHLGGVSGCLSRCTRSLGVSKNASPDELKKAYRKLVREVHPDRNPGSEERFKEVQGAYDVLSDPEKRKQYDRFGSMDGQPGPAPARRSTSATSTSATSSAASSSGGGGRQQPQRGQRGNDVEVEVRVSFEDALRGVQTTVPVQLELACHTCHGTGAAPGTAPKRCPSATAPASSRRRRGCSRCSSRARAATAWARSSRRRARRAAARAASGARSATP